MITRIYERKYYKYYKEEKVKYVRTGRPVTFYHYTKNKQAVENILKDGLKEDDFGYVYLTKYLSDHLDRSKYPIFRIDLPNDNNIFDWREVWEDNLDDKSYTLGNYIYSGNIQPEYLTWINREEFE